MNKTLAALILTCTVGCGAILNSKTTRVNLPPGVTLDGAAGSVVVSQQQSHEVEFPDGRRCVLEPHIGPGYVIADIVFWSLLGLIIDAATGDWKSLDGSDCPGISVD